AAKAHSLKLAEIASRLKDIGDNTAKYETVELCFEIMATRGASGSDQARVVGLIAKAIEFDLAELEKIRDVKIISPSANLTQEMRVEDLLGIDSNWNTERIKKHLRDEFYKWNNRLTTLPEGQERDNAQKMLDAISEARKRYD